LQASSIYLSSCRVDAHDLVQTQQSLNQILDGVRASHSYNGAAGGTFSAHAEVRQNERRPIWTAVFLVRRYRLVIRPIAHFVPSFALFRKVECCANQSDV
jgi:hypothetical protein